jgi:predicted Zn-dependent protease
MRREATAIALALAACAEATPPERPSPYDFAIRPLEGPVLTFHWPAASLPVRVWAEPGTSLETHMARAIQEWQGVALYGEFTGVLVRDSSLADVIVHLGEPFIPANTNARDCSGATRIEVALDTTIVLPFRTTISPRVGTSSADVNSCLEVVGVHELGHSLGLFLHSDDPTDLMHIRPSLDGLSARDRVTFTTLYHTPPSVRLPLGR